MENNARLTMSQFETLNKIIADLYDDALPLHNRIINFLYAMMGVVWFDRGTVLFFGKMNTPVIMKSILLSQSTGKKMKIL